MYKGVKVTDDSLHSYSTSLYGNERAVGPVAQGAMWSEELFSQGPRIKAEVPRKWRGKWEAPG